MLPLHIVVGADRPLVDAPGFLGELAFDPGVPHKVYSPVNL